MRYFIPLEDLELEESSLHGESAAPRPGAGNTKNQPRDGTSPPNRRMRREGEVDTVGSLPDRAGDRG